MPTYTCQTCQVQGLEEIGKHLSSTRHKTVKYDLLEETIQCEECGDSNIHLLKMIRYGLSDISLLCNDCSEKEGNDEELASYSLSNGSLFLKLPQYYKFRDIQCMNCHLEKDLYVADTGKGQLIHCRACFKADNNVDPNAHDYVSEKSDSFLRTLLGITEHVPKSNANSKKGGRKGARKTGKERRRPKKVDPNAEQRKAHYEAKMATKAQFQLGKTVKAVGSLDTTPIQSRSVTPKPSHGKDHSKKAYNSSSTVKGPKKNGDKSGKSSEPALKSQNGSADPKKASKKLQSKSPIPTGKSDKLKSPGPSEPKAQKGNKKSALPAVPSKGAPNSGSSNASNGGLKQRVKNGDTSSDNLSIKVPKPTTPLVLPPGISQFTPASEPPLLYPDLTSYFNEMCYNLFLEEKILLSNNNTSMLQPGEFILEWYSENNLKHKQYKIQILLTPEILDRYITKNMQSVKSSPFSQDQGIILVLDDRIPWYGRIAMVDTFSAKNQSSGKGHGKKGKLRGPKPTGPQICEIAVELYPWNTMPLPRTVDVKHLKLLPVSVPVGRVFFAMQNLLNPKFKDLLLGNKEVKQLNFKNYLQLTKSTFNESQKVGLQSVLNNSITVLQGPPGTGKTSTIHEIILQLLEKMNTSPILVVAASNIAIDNIAEKLLPKHGKSILRITSLQKEIEYNREHPLASICLHHKVFDGLPPHLQESLRNLRRSGEKISKSQYQKLMSAIIDYSNMVIGLSKVILTTTVTAGGLQLKALSKIPVVIMDEATQSSEPTTLIPLSMNGVEKFVFVGDHKQLSSFSDVPNLSLSLFERILRNGTYKTPHMLDTQYRMHPAISEFPRHKFYNNLLKDGITAEDRVKDGIPSNPVTFWDTEGKKAEKIVRTRFKSDGGMTYANDGEIKYLEKVLMTLIFDKGVKKSDIGVITPYRGQRDLISSTLVKNDLINPDKDIIHEDVDRDDFYNESKPLTIHTVSDIMIASIDAFQGREKDFMIMSCVRSNSENKVGFLKDERRLNVALTRARYGLIIIGDAKCLSNDPLWKEYIDDLSSKGLLLGGNEFLYS